MNYLFLVFLFFGMTAHDVQVAFYKIHQDDKTFSIDFVFEKDDVDKTFMEAKKQLSDESLQQYLDEHFALTINQEFHKLTFAKMQVSEEHIYVQGSFPLPEVLIQSLEIKNTCLLNIEDHSNIIEVRLNERERDFLMNLDRTAIKIDY